MSFVSCKLKGCTTAISLGVLITFPFGPVVHRASKVVTNMPTGAPVAEEFETAVPSAEFGAADMETLS